MTTEYWIKIDPEAPPQVLATGGEEALNLTQMQEAVGGLIEYCTFAQGTELPVPHNGDMVMGKIVDVIANEEGRIYGMPPNAIGTYCAFGMPAHQAPYPIVGAVLVHVRVDDDAKKGVRMEKLIEMVLGIETAQALTQELQEADYGVDE